MIVKKVKNVTTKKGPVSYEVTARIWGDDLVTEKSDLEFAELARKAINGIAYFPIERIILCNCSQENSVAAIEEKHDKGCAREKFGKIVKKRELRST
jgi:ABC-type lipopolysaccharide export system ATPase subunit